MKRLYYSALIASSLLSAQSLNDELNAWLQKTPHPNSVAEFKALPHLAPMNQDTTLICWSFATSSFLETEMERLKMPPVRLSVIYPLYCVYQEKAKRFLATNGASRFAPGDLFTGVLDIYKTYGAIPAEVYGKKKEGEVVLNHDALYDELGNLMKSVRQKQSWSDSTVLDQVRTILNKHLGAPPKQFTYNGKTYDAKTFLQNVVRLPWDEYVLVTSFQYSPFNQFTELKVPDNWGHQPIYFNVPLDVFYQSLKTAVTGGYSVAFDADISEPSYEMTKTHAFIPDFDTPRSQVNQASREFRFQNGTTTDDHLMHIVDFRVVNGEDWFLVKDSWRTAWEGPNKGYMFFHESYIKLKVLAYLVHRDAIPAVKKLLTAR